MPTKCIKVPLRQAPQQIREIGRDPRKVLIHAILCVSDAHLPNYGIIYLGVGQATQQQRSKKIGCLHEHDGTDTNLSDDEQEI